MIKIWRYYGSYFGAGGTITDTAITETTTADGVYTDEVLASIAESGFNGIWVHGQLHNLIWRPEFPELAPLAALHQERMNSLIRRAAKHGLKVYLYMQPPRALPVADEAFWSVHKDVGGQEIPSPAGIPGAPLYRSLCTSTDIALRPQPQRADASGQPVVLSAGLAVCPKCRRTHGAAAGGSGSRPLPP